MQTHASTAPISSKSTTDADRLIGGRIMAFRKEKGITQTQLGKKLGVTFQQVQKYERGQNRISASRLRVAADMLEVPLSEIIGNDADGIEHKLLASPDALKMLRTFDSITDATARQDALKLVAMIARNQPQGQA